MRWQWHQLDHMQIICTLLQTNNHTSTSWLNFLQARCSSWRPTNKPKMSKHWRHICEKHENIYIHLPTANMCINLFGEGSMFANQLFENWKWASSSSHRQLVQANFQASVDDHSLYEQADRQRFLGSLSSNSITVKLQVQLPKTTVKMVNDDLLNLLPQSQNAHQSVLLWIQLTGTNQHAS